MTLDRASTEVLRYLFNEYIKGPAVLYPINRILKSSGCSAVDVSDYLLSQQLIRERWIYPDETVACRITIRGMEKIGPSYVRNKLRDIIGGLGDSGGSKHLIEILELRLGEYSLTMDLIKQLEDLRLIKILHPKDEIVVELTPDGWKHFERGTKTFFTLMTY